MSKLHHTMRALPGAALLVATLSAASMIPVAAHASSTGPVVVELFTSEGCSSCPPADRVFDQLAQQKSIAGADIIALGEHVDYWDGPSWTDPFASAKFTHRQSAYSHAAGKSNVYTPQMLVDGRYAFVGGQPSLARKAIARSTRDTKAQLTLKPTGPNKVTIKVSQLPSPASGERKDILLAVTEDDLHSRITGGENGGRTLHYTAVVRMLKPIGHIRGGEKGKSSFTATVPMKPSWERRHLKLVALVQAHQSRHILGATAVPYDTLQK